MKRRDVMTPPLIHRNAFHGFLDRRIANLVPGRQMSGGLAGLPARHAACALHPSRAMGGPAGRDAIVRARPHDDLAEAAADAWGMRTVELAHLAADEADSGDCQRDRAPGPRFPAAPKASRITSSPQPRSPTLAWNCSKSQQMPG